MEPLNRSYMTYH